MIVASNAPLNSGLLSLMSVTLMVRFAVPVSIGMPLSLAWIIRKKVEYVSLSSCVAVDISPVIAAWRTGRDEHIQY